MNYFEISNSTRKDVGFIFPQSESMCSNYPYSSKVSVYNIGSIKKLDFKPNLDSFKLVSSAKVTDFISASTLPTGFLVNKKVKDIIERFNTKDCDFHSASIISNNEKYSNYYWLHLYTDVCKLIDFKTSVFYLTNSIGVKIERILISSIQEYKSIINGLDASQDIIYDKLNITNENELDLFKLTRISSSTFISERLKKEFEEMKISGIEIIEQQLF